jgi:hypothetical protein
MAGIANGGDPLPSTDVSLEGDGVIGADGTVEKESRPTCGSLASSQGPKFNRPGCSSLRRERRP